MSILSVLLNSGKVYNFEQAYGAKDITTREMRNAIKEWYALYYDEKPNREMEEDPCQRIPFVLVNKLTKTVFSEYSTGQTKGETANEFLGAVLAGLDAVKARTMQQALIGGVSWLKPIFCRDGSVSFNVISRGNVILLERDDMDRVTSIGSAERTTAGRDVF